MTTQVLQSWVAGRWQAGTGDGKVVRDAVTGEDVVRVTSDGLDLAEVARYARQVGGPALRGLDFGERAAVLKQVAATLDARKEELYELSARAGSTVVTAPSTSTAGSARPSSTPASAAGVCPQDASSWRGRRSRWARTAPSPASTS